MREQICKKLNVIEWGKCYFGHMHCGGAEK